MGGKAFTHSHPSLSIPRLTPQQYSTLLPQILAGPLSHLYKTLAVPPAAPEKDSHGDVDVLVCEPVHLSADHHPGKSNHSPEHIAQLLGAVAYVRGVSGGEASYAMPLLISLDGSPHTASAAAASRLPGSKDEVPAKVDKAGEALQYYQLDIHHVPRALFEWTFTTRSYGDLWMLVGVMVSRNDLSLTDEGLKIRVGDEGTDAVLYGHNSGGGGVEGAEGSNVGNGRGGSGGGINVPKRLRTMLLSSDIKAVMTFLGLHTEVFFSPNERRGFSTLEEAFDWVVQCRFFRREIFTPHEESADGKDVDGKATEATKDAAIEEEMRENDPGIGSGEATVKGNGSVMPHRVRKRVQKHHAKRPMFAAFMDAYLPRRFPPPPHAPLPSSAAACPHTDSIPARSPAPATTISSCKAHITPEPDPARTPTTAATGTTMPDREGKGDEEAVMSSRALALDFFSDAQAGYAKQLASLRRVIRVDQLHRLLARTLAASGSEGRVLGGKVKGLKELVRKGGESAEEGQGQEGDSAKEGEEGEVRRMLFGCTGEGRRGKEEGWKKKTGEEATVRAVLEIVRELRGLDHAEEKSSS